jgi:hypothetical protein
MKKITKLNRLIVWDTPVGTRGGGFFEGLED